MFTRDVHPATLRLREQSGALYAASFLWPPRVRRPITTLFTFFVDVADRIDRSERTPAALDDLDQRLGNIFGAAPLRDDLDREVREVIGAYQLPEALFARVRDAHAWDVDGRRYATEDALLDYVTRRFGAVACAVSAVLGARKPAALERACDLGVAIGLTRLASVVGDDARGGRVYLPLEWLDEAGVDVDTWLIAPAFNAPVGAVIERTLSTADGLYLRADPGLSELPFDCRPAARVCRYLGTALGSEIERAGFDTVRVRAELSAGRVARLIARSLRPGRAEQRAPFDEKSRIAGPILAAFGEKLEYAWESSRP